MKQNLQYFLFELKRAFSYFGKMTAAVCLLALICACIAGGLSHTAEHEPAASPYTVAVVLPENAGIHYNMGVAMVGQMDSFQGICTIRTTTSEDAARAMLDRNEAAAAVVIPEGMIHGIRDGSNLPARILYPAGSSRESVLFGSVVSALSRMLSAAQAGVYSLYDIYFENGVSDTIQERGNTELNSLYVNYVLGRNALFSEKSLSFSEDAPSWLSFVCGALCLLLLLSGVCLCGYLAPKSPELSHALCRLGVGRFMQSLAPALGAWLTMLSLFAPLFLAFSFFNDWLDILPRFGAAFLPALCVGLFFAAALALFLCRACKSRQISILFLFFVSFLSVFAAGGLLPTAFLPEIFRRLAPFEPVFYLRRSILAGLGGSADGQALLILFLWGIALIFLSSCIPAALPHSHPAARHTSPIRRRIRRYKGIHAFAWLSLIFRRNLRRPVSWILLCILIGGGLAVHFYKPEHAAISIALYCEDSDTFTSEITKRLEQGRENSLYRFYTVDSLEQLKEDVLWNKAECGYVFPSALLSRLRAGEEGLITAYTSSPTIVSNLALEDVFGSLFDSYSPIMLSDYIADAGEIEPPDNLTEIFEDWLEGGATFHVTYEDVPEDFLEAKNAFRLPIRGILALLMTAAAMAGTAQFRSDRNKGRLLLRFPGERLYLPCFYSIPLLLICCIGGLFAIFLSNESGPLLYELAAVFCFAALLPPFFSLVSLLCKSDLVFDALLPILVILCILYTPVLTDLSAWLPAGRILSRLLPTAWYLQWF